MFEIFSNFTIPESNPTFNSCEYIDSIIDSSLSDKNISVLSEVKLIKIEKCITGLLIHIKTLE